MPKMYFIFDGFENHTQRVPKSSINEVLLVTFHKQEQKLLDIWVFFMVLQWVSLKLMMIQVLENLVIYGTNMILLGFLRQSSGTFIFVSALANVFECSGLKTFPLLHYVIY